MRLTTHQPSTFADAVATRAEDPAALVVAGGTGLLPALTTGRLRPEAVLDLSAVDGFRDAATDGVVVHLAAGTTYTDVLERHAGPLPGLALAARTVAGRQVRNRGTLAGALVLADPSGDALAALVAADARIRLRNATGTRDVAAEDFVTAPGACVLAADELVETLLVPVATGPVAYAKAGARNAMARAVCGVAIALDAPARRVRAGVVGAGPTALRPRAAEDVASAADWHAPLAPEVAERFGALVAAAVDPPADERGSAAYRRRAAGVLARRALARAWATLREDPRWA